MAAATGALAERWGFPLASLVVGLVVALAALASGRAGLKRMGQAR